MATSNFYYRDTLYALDNTDDEFLYGDTVENIEHSLKQFDDLETDVYFDGLALSNDTRNFDGLVVVECHNRVTLENVTPVDTVLEICVTQRLILRGGYYTGFNLDRDITLNFNHTEHDVKDTLDDLADDIRFEVQKYDLFDIEECFDDEDTYDFYIENDVSSDIENALTKVQAEFDKVYHTLGQQYFEQYKVTARFSNGETTYAKV